MRKTMAFFMLLVFIIPLFTSCKFLDFGVLAKVDDSQQTYENFEKESNQTPESSGETDAKDFVKEPSSENQVDETEPAPLVCQQHSYSEWEEVRSSSCAEMGKKSRICTVCGITEEHEIVKLEHTYGDWNVISEANCKTSGRRERICLVCHAKNIQIIPKKEDHQYGNWQITQKPTCMAQGVESRVCSICGGVDTRNIACQDHKFGSYTVSKAAGYLEYGEEIARCKTCGITTTRRIPKRVTGTPVRPLAAREYYGYQWLGTLENGENYQRLYLMIANAVETMTREVVVPDSGVYGDKDFGMVMECYRADYPQHFWLDYHYSYGKRTGTNEITGFKLNFMTEFDGRITEARQQFDSICAEFLDGIYEEMTPYEREVLLHDRLVRWCEFNTSRDETEMHTAYGALVNQVAVCDGYAEAQQYLLYLAGVPAAKVVGRAGYGSHAWLSVRLGKDWYQLDTAWDDPMNGTYGGVSHEYFNVTTDFMKLNHVYEDKTNPNPYPIPVCTATEFYYAKKSGVRVAELSVKEIIDAMVELNDRGNSLTMYEFATDGFRTDLGTFRKFVNAKIDEIMVLAAEKIPELQGCRKLHYTVSISGRMFTLTFS